MSMLETAVPIVKKLRIPLSRDQVMLLMAAVNEIFLGIDIYLAHGMDGTIHPKEWIPIIFGPAAGILLLFAGLIAIKHRPTAVITAMLIFAVSIVVGMLGAYFHVVRAILPTAPVGERVTLDLLVWAPPLLGPLTFALVGLLGISAAWREAPADSGILELLGGIKLHMPYSKTRAYFFLISLGTLATVISSVLDHARTHFENPWLWVPTAAGVFGTVTLLAMGAFERPHRPDLLIFLGSMGLLVLTGVVGAYLHVTQNLVSQGTIVGERFLRGAPMLAPLLFANMGTLGIIILMDPKEKPKDDG